MKDRVSIIVLNWNGWRDTIECIESLFGIDYPDYEIILVDNGSEDNSVSMLKEWAKNKTYIETISYQNNKYSGSDSSHQFDSIACNKKIFLIKNDKNYGFAEGNNIAYNWLKNRGKTDYLLPLNNDTTVEKDFLSGLVKCSKALKDNSIIQPVIMEYFNKNVAWDKGGKINWFLLAVRMYKTKDIPDEDYYESSSVSGCAFLVNMKTLLRLGLFDPAYFAYFEDLDLSVRANKMGIKCYISSKSAIYHKILQSSCHKKPFLYYLAGRNRIIFLKKHCSNIFHYYLLLFPHITIKVLRIAIRSVFKLNFKFIKNHIKGVMDGLRYKV